MISGAAIVFVKVWPLVGQLWFGGCIGSTNRLSGVKQRWQAGRWGWGLEIWEELGEGVESNI